jgi:hypothetical protein
LPGETPQPEPPPELSAIGARTPQQAILALNIPSIPDGQPFEYHLIASLTPSTSMRLAKIILQCRGRGTNALHLVTKEGVPLAELNTFLMKLGLPTPILVSPTEFHVLAHHAGL